MRGGVGVTVAGVVHQCSGSWPSRGFQAVEAPLTAMFKADLEWEWTAVHQASFDKLKQAMISATHLSAINPRQPYHLYTDASKDCVDATLAQRCAHGKYKGHL